MFVTIIFMLSCCREIPYFFAALSSAVKYCSSILSTLIFWSFEKFIKKNIVKNFNLLFLGSMIETAPFFFPKLLHMLHYVHITQRVCFSNANVYSLEHK